MMILQRDLDRLKAWFLETKRDLPWRNAPTPYAVWVSEIMLQQTQASVVVPYFERWMECFPTLQSLALASPERVLKLWEGLGYYSRARSLLEGAKMVCERFQGELPQEEHELRSIKGLGPYTVGAIRSFAFHQKATAVDGNVLRVVTRYCEIFDDISKTKTIRGVSSLVERSLPEDEPWVINEALIELGAMVCKKKPLCSSCPLKEGCRAHLKGSAHRIPFKPAPPQTILLHRRVPVICAQGHLLVKHNKTHGVMRDLYEFPYIETGGSADEDMEKQILNLWGLKVRCVGDLGKISHTFTRYKAQLQVEIFSTEACVSIPDYEWRPLDELRTLPFSAGHKKILDQWILWCKLCAN